MLLPKKVKHRKWHRTRRNLKVMGVETRGTTVDFGQFGLKSISYGRITSNQLESARKVIARSVSKTGRIWCRIFPDRPITKKPPEVPMGSGKGDVQGYCFEVKPGRVIFEIDGVTDVVGKEALRKAGTKLPVKSKIVTRA